MDENFVNLVESLTADSSIQTLSTLRAHIIGASAKFKLKILRKTNVVDKLMVTLTSDDLIVKKLSLVALDCLLQCLRGNKESKAIKVIDKIKLHKKALCGIVDLLSVFCGENDQSGVETVLILL